MKLTNLDHIHETVSRLELLQEELHMSCPNFYLTSTSEIVLEQTAQALVKALSHSKLIPFQGAVTNFAISVPCLSTADLAVKFLNRLEDSLQIARDIYAKWVGIILLVLDKAWADYDNMGHFEMVLHEIRFHPELCFVVMLPVTENGSDVRVKKALCHCATWIEMDVNFSSVQQCVDELCDDAQEAGFQVTGEAKEYLLDTMTGHLEDVPFPDALTNLLRQIVLERSLVGDGNRSIGLTDVQRFVQPALRREVRIGFSVSEPQKGIK